MSNKKIIGGISLVVFALILSGCGNKTASVQTQTDNNVTKNEKAAQSSIVQKMPEATGNVDDTTRAIIDGASSEISQVTSTDADAASAVGDGEDTNNLNSTYDQNAL